MNVAQHILVVDDEPDLRVLDALLRVPALTPKALAALKVAPRTGTALLRELQAGGGQRGDGAGEFLV